jgi:ectoine hydroxylase-related dioxygenase (phytanoyl-CoA dioxygenase family)
VPHAPPFLNSGVGASSIANNCSHWFTHHDIRSVCVHVVVGLQDAGLDHRGAPNSAPEAERVQSFGRDAMVNVWTGFIPVGRPEGCMLMIPGTHKLGCVEHVLQGLARDPDATDVAADMDTMASDSDVRGYSQGYQSTDRATYSTSIHPDIVAREEAQCAPVPIETFPGDVVLFQNLTFHCGTANSSKSVRWSMDWRYQDADQPTHRPPQGYLARSALSPDQIPSSPAVWAATPFQ